MSDVIQMPIKNPARVFAAQVAEKNREKNICRGCGAPVPYDPKFLGCCDAICVRDAYC